MDSNKKFSSSLLKSEVDIRRLLTNSLIWRQISTMSSNIIFELVTVAKFVTKSKKEAQKVIESFQHSSQSKHALLLQKDNGLATFIAETMDGEAKITEVVLKSVDQ
ncbi:unnamed protein product [Arctia plantaginis]|uniref:Uncharacterized protein n=1 Tax=Arctia plantaginis TaxID=874455 RepID=A0A8S1AQL1_ARCPL|nr:unnamed protein product [Arctia plantaginis]CAB3247315.1 unnamed protein product [Arctia plantaginis]